MKKATKISAVLFVANVLCFLFPVGISAQDFHLSHYESNPLYLNPALTGCRLIQPWDYRANVNYRSQWKKLQGKPFTTIAAGYDMPFKDKFSVGAFVLNNNGAKGLFNTLNFIVSGSYKITHKDVDKKRHHLNVGLQAGLLQKSINPGSYFFDSQYSATTTDAFDENLPTQENFTKEQLMRFDANVGIFYKFIDKNKSISPFGGISIYHITRPNESFTGKVSKLPMRFSFHGGCDYMVNEQITILPQFLIMNQMKATELNIEALGFYKIQETDYEPMLGLAWRMKDAIVLHMGLKQKSNVYRISYDINTSYLKNYSGGRGAIEFSVIYAGSFKTPRVPMVMFN